MCSNAKGIEVIKGSPLFFSNKKRTNDEMRVISNTSNCNYHAEANYAGTHECSVSEVINERSVD